MSRAARVLIVDDSVVIRGLLSRFVDAEPDLEVASTAADGRVGVQKARSLKPDLILLDVEMPVMNGLEALREIRTFDEDVPIIMFSPLTGQGANVMLDALAAGASDYAAKPPTTGGAARALEQVRGDLIVKIRGFVGDRRPRLAVGGAKPATAGVARTRMSRPASGAPIQLRRSTGSGTELRAVAVGSSTGGPVALEEFLCGIPDRLVIPVFLVQHMPQRFTTALAERLGRRSVHRVVEVLEQMTAQPGHVYLAGGGRHMRLRRIGTDVKVEPFDGPPVNSCRPSVDPLFESVAEVYGNHALVVMLTGMGSDGTDGTSRLAALGCDVIVQDEATSVVWGMPGSVAEHGLATEILPLPRIGPRVSELVHGRAAIAAAHGGRT